MNTEAQASAVNNMTAEQFYAALEENTRLINKERARYVSELAIAKQLYDKQTDLARKQVEDIQIERDALYASITAKKAELNAKERKVRDFRRQACNDYAENKIILKNSHALRNVDLMNQRDSLFVQYRLSGGQVMADADLLLHPEKAGKKLESNDGGQGDE